MTTQHAPGPWTYTRDAWTDEHPFSVAVGSRIICDVSVFTGHDEANARLIAAAPELLESLRLMLDAALPFLDYHDDDDLQSAVESAQAVIAKARGEG